MTAIIVLIIVWTCLVLLQTYVLNLYRCMPLSEMSLNQLSALFKMLCRRADSMNVDDCRFKYYQAKACRVSNQIKTLHSASLPVGTYTDNPSTLETQNF